ncbi:hypothetical protein RJ639_032262 [Escallonia herrerae]|uniref:RNase H type-1 domain-containing protein n=1 Tax=Escallonia herrerae TaxID=1293975 RepID=A0AA89B8W5_9ASTE|nr:hypothetical protein RJ639_032262 [Escallonia herrerae]
MKYKSLENDALDLYSRYKEKYQGLSRKVNNLICPLTAEALAVLDGIKLAQQLECQIPCTEGDTAKIISVLKNMGDDFSKFAPVIHETKKLASSCQEVLIL